MLNMNHDEARRRRRSLQHNQIHRVGVDPQRGYNYEALKQFAEESGVPARQAGTLRRDLVGMRSRIRKAEPVIKVFDGIMSDIEAGKESVYSGALVTARKMTPVALLLAAVFNGAVVRAKSSRFVEYSDLVAMFRDQVSMSQNADEFETGTLEFLLSELDDLKYVYDLVIIHRIDQVLTSPFVHSEMLQLVVARSSRGLYTILTGRSGVPIGENLESVWSLVEEEYRFVPSEVFEIAQS
jgi:uncharacterized protein YfkK (UPF0435 family)